MDDDFVDHVKAEPELFEDAPEAAGARKAGKKDSRKRKRGVDQDEDATCFAESCPNLRLKGKRWCKSCNRSYDCMYYQARQNNEVASLEAALSTPEGAAEAIGDFQAENPDDAKYKKKKLINWAQFKQKYSVAHIKRDRSGCKPFEYTQWLKRGESIMGWTPAQTKNEWERFKKDRNIDRDKKGLGGCLRLWLPVIEEKHLDRDVAATKGARARWCHREELGREPQKSSP